MLPAVAQASANAAEQIREDLADSLRRLELINLPLPAARLSNAIDTLDQEIARLSAFVSVSELG